MTKKTNPYSNPKWQKKRLEIMERDNFTCRWCGENKKTLNVHHKFYIPNHEIWDYNDVQLITLCEDCHTKFSQLKNSILFQIQSIENRPIEIMELIHSLLSFNENYLFWSLRELVATMSQTDCFHDNN